MSEYLSEAGPRLSLSVGVSSPPARKKKKEKKIEHNHKTNDPLDENVKYCCTAAQRALQAARNGGMCRGERECPDDGGGVRPTVHWRSPEKIVVAHVMPPSKQHNIHFSAKSAQLKVKALKHLFLASGVIKKKSVREGG